MFACVWLVCVCLFCFVVVVCRSMNVLLTFGVALLLSFAGMCMMHVPVCFLFCLFCCTSCVVCIALSVCLYVDCVMYVCVCCVCLR